MFCMMMIVSGFKSSIMSFQSVLKKKKHTVPAPSSFRMLLSYDSSNYFAEELPSQSVISAVESIAAASMNNNNNNNRKRGNKSIIIASDVASKAGVSLSQARRDLTKLAALTLGDIAVSKEGELLYSFPADVTSVLSNNSIKYKASRFVRDKVWPVVFYATRVSFGVALLASIAIIYSTIAFVSSSSSSSDTNDDRRRSRSSLGGGGFLFGDGLIRPSLLDFFYYRPYYYGYNSNPQQQQRNKDPNNEMGFLESVFSYIFGDGNPNMNLEEKRLKLASHVIRQNRGAVTAEQLAPFCDNVPILIEGDENIDSPSLGVDEGYVLPIVSQLGGEPQVTEEGDIIYVFPDLQLSATESSALEKAGLKPDATAREIQRELQLAGIDVRGVLEKDELLRILNQSLLNMDNDGTSTMLPVLQEEELKFSAAGDFQRLAAGALGIVNLFGALYLGNLLASPSLNGARLPGYFGLIQMSYPFLLAYAILFNIIPLARSVWINQENQKIQARNQARRSWYTLVQSNIGRLSGRIAKKLRSAQLFGSSIKKLGTTNSEIVYDTSQAIADDEAKREEAALKDFDQKVSS